MAWNNIPYSYWQYNDTPTEPSSGNIGQHYLWSLQTNGIRPLYDPNDNLVCEIYTQCRLSGLSASPCCSADWYSQGELNKTHWDAIALALSGTPWPPA